MSESVDLEVVLKAKGVEVATSRDAGIWLTTMGLITGNAPTQQANTKPLPDEDDEERPSEDAIGKFATELGVSREQLEGAAGPSNASPFIHLDDKYFEALKSTAGTKSVAPVALAATLLLLWDRHEKIGDVTITACGNVLRTINLGNKNATRGIKNCPWVQIRGNSLKLNPAQISQAEALARKYCTGR